MVGKLSYYIIIQPNLATVYSLTFLTYMKCRAKLGIRQHPHTFYPFLLLLPLSAVIMYFVVEITINNPPSIYPKHHTDQKYRVSAYAGLLCPLVTIPLLMSYI